MSAAVYLPVTQGVWCPRYTWWRAKHSAARLRTTKAARLPTYVPHLHRAGRW
ncbi:MAG: hypothetical protein KGL42_07975 [Betaproteobacteria bacterium]|nr:hypothetical protein [Betaproteobacteria bacterium]